MKVSQEAREAAARAMWTDMLATGQANDLRHWDARSGVDDGWSWESPALDDKTKERIRTAADAAIAAALPFIEAETLERAARVAESHYMWAGKPDYVPACRSIGLAIRNLKDKSNV